MSDLISRQAAIDHLKKRLYETALNNNTEHPYYEEIADNRVDIWLNELPSAQPEPCEDAVSREEAKWVVFCNRDHVEDQANAIDALPPVTPKAEQPDMSEYSDKLWKAAYERGKAEAQAELPEWAQKVEEYRKSAPSFVRNQLVWALYQTWKEYDGRLVHQRGKENR